MENLLTNQSQLKEKRHWQAVALAGGLILLLGLAGWMIVSQMVGDIAQDRQQQAQALFEAETGIRVVRLAYTAMGGMVDLQYQAVDPDKALVIHDDDNPPMLVNQKTGSLISRPQHGHGFKELRVGILYHLLIVNEGSVLERGDRVTLVLGEWRLEDLVVE
jgi:hypothetical protein